MGGTALFKANLYAMGALFLVFRVFFYPIGIYKLYIGYKMQDKNIAMDKQIIGYVLSTLYVALYLLQLIWFTKIISSIKKNNKRLQAH
jgi:hypothetical protein